MRIWSIPLIMLLLLLAFPFSALGGGFEFPDNGAKSMGRGGAMTASVDDPSAIWFNPANLSRINSFAVTADVFVHNYDSTFDRAGSNPNTGEDYELVSNEHGLFPAGWLLLGYNFGWNDFTLAAGILGPSAVGSRDFPEMGPQRYTITSENILLIYYSLGAAISLGDFRFGLVFQLSHLEIDYTMHVDAFPSQTGKDLPRDYENPNYSTPINIQAGDIRPAGMLGITWEINRSFQLAFSARSPIFHKATGKVKADFPDAMSGVQPALTEDGGQIELSEALKLRLGARFVYEVEDREIFDVELDVVYEMWSMMKEFKVHFDGSITLYGDEQGKPIGETILPKNWKDTVSVRLGTDIHLTDWFLIRVGGFFESAAAPTETTHLDFMPFGRVGVGAGATVFLGDFDINLGFQYIHQIDRTVDDSILYPVAPLSDCHYPYTSESCVDGEGNPGPVFGAQGNGSYTSNIMSFGLGVVYHL